MSRSRGQRSRSLERKCKKIVLGAYFFRPSVCPSELESYRKLEFNGMINAWYGQNSFQVKRSMRSRVCGLLVGQRGRCKPGQRFAEMAKAFNFVSNFKTIDKETFSYATRTRRVEFDLLRLKSRSPDPNTFAGMTPVVHQVASWVQVVVKTHLTEAQCPSASRKETWPYLSTTPSDAHCCYIGTDIKHHVPLPDQVKYYKWRLNPVWHAHDALQQHWASKG